MWKIFFIVSLFAIIAFSDVVTEDFINDLKTLTQSVACYVNSADLNTLRFTEEAQILAVKYYKKVLFSPWRQALPYTTTAQIQSLVNNYSTGNWYAENKLRKDSGEFRRLKLLSNLENYPNCNKKAISIRNTSLRLLPTHKPNFYDFAKPGEGYPFDMLQNTGIPLNTPLFVAHFSKDKMWVFVESAYASGWMPLSDLAFTSEQFVENWKQFSFYTPLIDAVALVDAKGLSHGIANIGALLPMENSRIFIVSDIIDMVFSSSHSDKYKIIAVEADGERQAYLVNCDIGSNFIGNWPLRGSLNNLAKVADNMMNQPYGWGDLYGNRDCASTLKDLFGAFGRWLPRNGNDQARAGKYVSLTGLDVIAKTESLQREALPLGTLLWFKGHIMLYIGLAPDSTPLIFHNVWGLRTVDKDQKEDRLIIGKTVISTLEAGKEREGVKNSWLKRLEGMTIL